MGWVIIEIQLRTVYKKIEMDEQMNFEKIDR